MLRKQVSKLDFCDRWAGKTFLSTLVELTYKTRVGWQQNVCVLAGPAVWECKLFWNCTQIICKF